jgi:hypothetical protein
LEKSIPNILATSATFRKLPKVNNHPNGENSPNLVTLVKGLLKKAKASREKQVS